MKDEPRARGGFVPLGRFAAEAAGSLPKRLARQLLLEHAWGRAAGEAIAQRARPVRVQRGVLEVVVADPAWARELAPILPRIVGRLARRHPDLGVKRFRLLADGAPLLEGASEQDAAGE